MKVRSIKIIVFKNLEKYPELIHGMSTRAGGVSRAPFTGLNLGLSTTDDLNAVQENRQQFFKTLGIAPDRMVFPQQVHSDHVEVVMQPGSISRTDALITNQKSLFLTVQTADCFPVFLYDPRFMVTGIVHSGWRGTAGNIVGKTIRKMQNIFGCSPGILYAAVGAGIQGTCYPVDDKTASYFDTRYCVPDGPGHCRLDIQRVILDQLCETGVQLDHIESDETCTHCAADMYYSYRRDGRKSGRMMAVIGMRNIIKQG
jgi:hypothetical protein